MVTCGWTSGPAAGGAVSYPPSPFPPNPLPRWVPSRPRLVLVAVYVAVIAEAPLYSILGTVAPVTGPAWLAALFGMMILGLQLRHSLAMARGERPRGGIWTLLALAVLAYV